jgi:hypothetical protein
MEEKMYGGRYERERRDVTNNGRKRREEIIM